MIKLVLSALAFSLATNPSNENMTYIGEKPMAGFSKLISEISPDVLQEKSKILANTVSGQAITVSKKHVSKVIKTPKKKKDKFKKIKKSKRTYYTTCAVNFRSKPIIRKKTVIKVIHSYRKVKVLSRNKNWYQVRIDNKKGYIKRGYLKKAVKINKKVMKVSYSNTAFKAWMPYSAITCKSSPQYKLQANEAYTGQYGIRQVDGRFCAALGSYFTSRIGIPFDIVLKNGAIIPCITADQKADEDTDGNNIRTEHDGSIVEFIVSRKYLKKSALSTGNIGSCNSNWNDNIDKIVMYK